MNCAHENTRQLPFRAVLQSADLGCADALLARNPAYVRYGRGRASGFSKGRAVQDRGGVGARPGAALSMNQPAASWMSGSCVFLMNRLFFLAARFFVKYRERQPVVTVAMRLPNAKFLLAFRCRGLYFVVRKQ